MLNAELKSLATNADITVDELERQIAEYGNYIDSDTDDFGWNHDAVAKIISESLKAKEESGLLPMLRNHPDYHEEIKSVVIRGTIPKDIDYGTIAEFNNRVRSWIVKKYRDIHDESNYMPNEFYSWMVNINNTITSARNNDDITLTKIDLETIKSSAWNLDYIPAIPVDSSKLPFTVGMKRTKAVGKYLDMLGIKEYAKGLPMTVQHGLSRTVETNEYDVWFSKFGDAMSNKGKDVYYVISAYPLDFIRSSCGGKYGWSSCHNPLRDRYDGCNCSGGISYGLDDVTLEMYVLPADVGCDISEFPLQDKLMRCMVHFGNGFRYFIADGVYPNKREDENIAFRGIMQSVVAESLGVENLWRIRKEYPENTYSYTSTNTGATCYPDYFYANRNNGSLSYLSTLPTSEIHQIYIGAKPISTKTGDRHSVNNDIEGYTECCENCGEAFCDREDEEVYSEFHREYGCTSCMRYSDYDDDWYYNDEIVDDVRGYRGTVSIYALRESGYFVQCEECGDWFYEGEDVYYCEDDGVWICRRCLDNSDYYAMCYDCEEVHIAENMLPYEDGEYICDSCTTTCSECGSVIRKCGAKRNSDGDVVCDECYKASVESENGIAIAS